MGVYVCKVDLPDCNAMSGLMVSDEKKQKNNIYVYYLLYRSSPLANRL